MEIERAIEILDPEHREHYESIEPVMEACRMGMEALEKQIPKKPNGMQCSVCGEQIFFEPIDHNQKTYCWLCGQKIDWEDD